MADKFPTAIRAGNEKAHADRSAYLQVETQILKKPKLKNDLTVWLQQNRRVEWIVNTVQTGYGIQITPTQLTAFSVRQGLHRRRDNLAHNLIPWKIERHSHARMYPYLMLSAEARLRAGVRQSGETVNRLVLWKDKLATDGHVVDYRPNTFEVWWYVPARPGIDLDLIRVPQ